MKKSLVVDKKFLQICESMSELSKCQSKNVCALAVRNDRIIATGINGTLPGFINCNEKFPNGVNEHNRKEHSEWSLLYEAHAEDNLISELAKSTITSVGITVYINLQPCTRCTMRLASIGVKRVVFSKLYDNGDIDFSKTIFKHSNIEFDYIKI